METRNFNEFITVYNELDKFMREALKLDEYISHADLIKRMASKSKVFVHYKDDLLSYARLRNVIVHNPDKRNADPIANPHEFVVKKYKQIVSNVINPVKALDSVAIRSDKIFTAGLDDKALDVMSIMNKNIFTHVPIIDSDKMVGIFSENTILSYIVSMKEVIIEKDAKIREFLKFIPLEKHESEYFDFVSRNSLVTDIEEKFSIELKKGKRLAVVFITENGNPKEKLLGMLTAWDIAGYHEEKG